jgi:hypothetical protein
MDHDGVVLGYRDRRGRFHALPQDSQPIEDLAAAGDTPPAFTAAQAAGLAVGNLLDAQGGVLALSEVVEEVLANPTATTQILTGTGEYSHYRCTTAVGNITIYDNTASSGKVIVPTTALTVGTFPVFGAGISRSLIVSAGIRVVLSGPATVYIGRLSY